MQNYFFLKSIKRNITRANNMLTSSRSEAQIWRWSCKLCQSLLLDGWKKREWVNQAWKLSWTTISKMIFFSAVSWPDGSDFDSREIIDYLPKPRIYITSMNFLKKKIHFLSLLKFDLHAGGWSLWRP